MENQPVPLHEALQTIVGTAASVSVPSRRRAGALVRINLAPMMGRRDAVLDAAEVLLNAVRNRKAPIETAYTYLNGLFAAADRNTFRISGMFNNQDTVAREQRLAMQGISLPDNIREVYMNEGGTPHLDGQYTVFGEVVEGLEIVDKIQSVITDDMDRPVEDVRIIKAERVK